jgi:hypothetical protein
MRAGEVKTVRLRLIKIQYESMRMKPWKASNLNKTKIYK